MLLLLKLSRKLFIQHLSSSIKNLCRKLETTRRAISNGTIFFNVKKLSMLWRNMTCFKNITLIKNFCTPIWWNISKRKVKFYGQMLKEWGCWNILYLKAKHRYIFRTMTIEIIMNTSRTCYSLLQKYRI